MSQDTFTVTRNVSWGSRIKGAFGGILFGLLLFVVSFPLLFWNEGNAVQTARSLEEGAGVVVSVPSDSIDPANEGKLVHLTGTASAETLLADPTTGVARTGIQLIRNVEMFQWEETSSTKTEKNLGGSETQTTTYSYDTRWLDHPVDSSSFHKRNGHENPAFPLASDRWTSDEVTVGGFALTQEQAAAIGGATGAPLTGDDVAKAQGSFDERLRRQANFLVTGEGTTPKVGDVRISYELVPNQTLSLVARQAGSGIAPYATSNGRELFMMERGGMTAEQMFADAQRANTIMTWILRAVGTLLMWLGLTLIFRPISVMADVIPFLGNLAEKGIGLVAGMIAAPFALFTIAFAWLFYRPLIGVGLIAVGVVLFVLIKRAGDKKVTPPPLPA